MLNALTQTMEALHTGGERQVSERAATMGGGFAELLTRDIAMLRTLEQAKRLATTDEPVLAISGAAGTGKKLLARAMHRASRRAQGPFVTVACGGGHAGLLESELFGYVRGAFGGATREGTGQFVAANGGTLVLEDVCDLPASLQAKLVQAIVERRVRPIGASADLPVDVRLICTTRRSIAEQAAAGLLRPDFAARLGAASLSLPPLDARRQDVPMLAQHFLAQWARRALGHAGVEFSAEALGMLNAAAWPGNVAQLRCVVEQAAASASGQSISADVVRQLLTARDPSWLPLDEARRAFERSYLVRILEITGGSVTRAARLAGRNRTEFYRLLSRHDLHPATFKNAPPRH